MHLLGLGERLAVGTLVDDVTDREALGSVALVRLQHAQADIDDDVGGAFTKTVTRPRRSLVVTVGVGELQALMFSVP